MQGQLGGGYLVGKVDDKGELTGPDIAYIYPDFRCYSSFFKHVVLPTCRTAIRGEFVAGQMVSGRQCQVISSCQVAFSFQI